MIKNVQGMILNDFVKVLSFIYWVISQSCTQVIQQFKIEWGQPFSNILEALELMAFDLDRCFLCEGFQMHRGICQEQKSMPFLAWSDTWLSWQQDAKVCQMLCNPSYSPVYSLILLSRIRDCRRKTTYFWASCSPDKKTRHRYQIELKLTQVWNGGVTIPQCNLFLVQLPWAFKFSCLYF